MAYRRCCDFPPFATNLKTCGFEASKDSSMLNKGLLAGFVRESSTENFILGEIQRRIQIFRDVIDLPLCHGSASLEELMMKTMEDLREIYPEIMSIHLETQGVSIKQGLLHFYKALKSLAHSWSKTVVLPSVFTLNVENISFEQLVHVALEAIDYMIKVAGERADLMDVEDERNECNSMYLRSNIGCCSPISPTSVLPEETNSPIMDLKTKSSYNSALLLPLRVQSVGKLKLVDLKCFSSCKFLNMPKLSNSSIQQNNASEDSKAESQKHSKLIVAKLDAIGEDKDCATLKESSCGDHKSHTSMLPSIKKKQDMEPTELPQPLPMPIKTKAMPPPPPPMSRKDSRQPMPQSKLGGPPPPPPLGGAKSTDPKKVDNKLKRSTQIGNLYRLLKGKVEGGNQVGKSDNGRKGHAGGNAGGKKGMADALAEMAKRSAYFRQIEEDVEKYAKSIMELKNSISSFQTNDMAELTKFHKHVESILENLTDETQVLSRFEGFPTKKLEALRIAATLYSRLDAIKDTLNKWEIVSPLGQLLDKVESYFNKIKSEIDALERTKDEEVKRFQSYNIYFDFNIIVRIKESMVDVSSSCMELALKERRSVNGREIFSRGGKSQSCVKMLWRAFQFAFRVYTFAGGHDERADELTRELAHEIEADPLHTMHA